MMFVGPNQETNSEPQKNMSKLFAKHKLTFLNIRRARFVPENYFLEPVEFAPYTKASDG
jgi:hypothetical protein